MFEYRVYPRWMYGPNNMSVIVQDQEGEAALGEGWSHFPLEKQDKPEPVVARVEPEPVAVVSDEAQVWLDRAAAVNLKVDRRWGSETVKARVLEAEALASA